MRSQAFRGRAEFLLRLSSAAADPAEATRLAGLAAENFERAGEMDGDGADPEPVTDDAAVASAPGGGFKPARSPGGENWDAITTMILANDAVPDVEAHPFLGLRAGIAVELRDALDHVVREPLPTALMMRLQQLAAIGGHERGGRAT